MCVEVSSNNDKDKLLYAFIVIVLSVVFFLSYFFFFSSRRRHTRWNCDWSSDVCSSDLLLDYKAIVTRTDTVGLPQAIADACKEHDMLRLVVPADLPQSWVPSTVTVLRDRSEERRVGKECRCRRGEDE